MRRVSNAANKQASTHVLQNRSCIEPLETRRYLDGLVPAKPDNVSAQYLLGHIYFAWQDASLGNGYSIATQYVIEASPVGVGNWTTFQAISKASALDGYDRFHNELREAAFARDINLSLTGANRLAKYPHDRQKWYRIHAVDADGDSSPTTGPFQVQGHPEDAATQVSAAVQSSGAVKLSWISQPGKSYHVSRRLFGSTGDFVRLTSNAVPTGFYVDGIAVAGAEYEYALTEFGYNYPTAFVVAGNEVAAVENRGKIVLLVDDAVAGAIRGYVARLQSDLVGDGWTVLRHNVYRNQSIDSVKEIIRSDYNTSLQNGLSAVKQALLLGHVPVPYSGSSSFDGHNDHIGAYPTDAYYGDMDGEWTDAVSYTATGTGRTNGIGDGRFDQEYLTTNDDDSLAPELAVGRVDMWSMGLAASATSESEKLAAEADLLKQYLRKNHEYRLGTWNIRKKAIIYNNFNSKGQEAYSEFGTLVGSNNIDAGYYFDPTKTRSSGTADRSYIWGWADGPGNPDYTQFYGADLFTSHGGGASDFLSPSTAPNIVFNQMFGSYFADWDRPNNFLRSAIAGRDGYGLVS